MSLYTLPNATKGIDTIVQDTITAVPSFPPMILIFVFMVVFLGGITRQKSRLGTADYPMWATVSSLATFLIAILMSLGTGFINLTWLSVVVAITIMSGVWLFLDRKASEL